MASLYGRKMDSPSTGPIKYEDIDRKKPTTLSIRFIVTSAELYLKQSIKDE